MKHAPYISTVQWSTHPDFVVLGGEVELRDLLWKSEGNELNEIKTAVTDLPSSARCYFRVAAGNLAGYGSFKPTLPPSVFLSGMPHFYAADVLIEVASRYGGSLDFAHLLLVIVRS
jgi:hypothetical protein